MSVSTCDDNEWFTTGQIAEMFGISINTVYAWRRNRTGPPGARIGRRVKYRRNDVAEWLKDQYQSETSA